MAWELNKAVTSLRTVVIHMQNNKYKRNAKQHAEMCGLFFCLGLLTTRCIFLIRL